MWTSVTDLARRQAMPLEGTAEEWWESSASLQHLLAREAAEWWVAESERTGELVGFARSIERGGLFELTEFFVHPEAQAQGIGRALLDRAFPMERGGVRSIISTADTRAQARYYLAGTSAQFPIYTLGGAPKPVTGSGNLDAVPMTDAGIDVQRRLERAVLGYQRSDDEISWLMERRRATLYMRGDEFIGYSFVGRDGTGPIGALTPGDMPPILLHAEGVAHDLGMERFSLDIPAPGADAIRHLLARGYRFDRWINFLMSNRPFGQFDRFIPFSPPLFL